MLGPAFKRFFAIGQPMLAMPMNPTLKSLMLSPKKCPSPARRGAQRPTIATRRPKSTAFGSWRAGAFARRPRLVILTTWEKRAAWMAKRKPRRRRLRPGTDAEIDEVLAQAGGWAAPAAGALALHAPFGRATRARPRAQTGPWRRPAAPVPGGSPRADP